MANKTLDEKQRWMRDRTVPLAEPSATGVPGSAFERHYKPRELAKLWGFDESTVRRLFLDQPGVLKISSGLHGKRAYVSLRIPASVAEKVYRERTQ